MGSVIIFTQIAPPVRMRNEHWQRKLSEDFALFACSLVVLGRSCLISVLHPRVTPVRRQVGPDRSSRRPRQAEGSHRHSQHVDHVFALIRYVQLPPPRIERNTFGTVGAGSRRL